MSDVPDEFLPENPAVLADHPEFTRKTPRYCPNCWAFSPWHRDGTPPTTRRCNGCGRGFKDTPTKGEILDETGGEA